MPGDVGECAAHDHKACSLVALAATLLSDDLKATSRDPAPAVPRVTIDFEYYPSIRDAVLSYSCGGALLRLRATSRHMRRLVDTYLPEHIEVGSDGAVRILCGGRALPESWTTDRVFTRWVRYVDYAVTPAEYYTTGGVKPGFVILRRRGGKVEHVAVPSAKMFRLRGASLLLLRVPATEMLVVKVPEEPSASSKDRRFFPLKCSGSVAVLFSPTSSRKTKTKSRAGHAPDKCIARMRAQRLARTGQALLADISRLLSDKAWEKKIVLVGVEGWAPLLGLTDSAAVRPAIEAHTRNDPRVVFLDTDRYRRAVGKRAYNM